MTKPPNVFKGCDFQGFWFGWT